jgi:hypothetical protein
MKLKVYIFKEEFIMSTALKEEDNQIIDYLKRITGNKVPVELELTKHNQNNSDGELIKEETFVIDLKYFNKVYKELNLGKNYLSKKEFLDWYDPEEEGLLIYNKAKEDNKIKHEFTRDSDGNICE